MPCVGLQRRIDEEVRHVAIEPVAPRIPFGLRAAARGLFPLGFGRQPERLASDAAQPRAIRRRIVVADERDRMIGAIGGGWPSSQTYGAPVWRNDALALGSAGA